MSDKKYLVSESQLKRIYMEGMEYIPPNSEEEFQEFVKCIVGDSPLPQKSLSEMTEEDMRVLCEKMGWGFQDISPGGVYDISVSVWDEDGELTDISFDNDGHFSMEYGFNAFKIVECLQELGYGVERKGAGG